MGTTISSYSFCNPGTRVYPCPHHAIGYHVLYREISPASSPTWQLQAGYYCPTRQHGVTVAAIQAAVERAFRRLPLPRGSVTLEPATKAVVNLPVIAYTNTPAEHFYTVTALGATVHLTARPVRWLWSWGSGQPDTVTTGPGAGYPTCQSASIACAAATYSYPGRAGPIAVAVSWTATYTIVGVPGQFSITDPVTVTTGGRTLPVYAAPPELVKSS